METQQLKIAMPTPFVDRSGKHQHFTSVNMTTDHSRFKFMNDNREVNEIHLRRLTESMRERYLISPILVNEKMEIIDGQHRVLAATQLGFPIYYIIVKHYGINEVAIFNTNQKNWNKNDYLNMYATEGRKPYVQMLEFMTEFPEFGIQTAIRLVTNKVSMKGKEVDHTPMKDFENGKLVITDIDRAYRYGQRLMDFKPFYPNGFTRNAFVCSLIPLFSSKVYNHKEMIIKCAGPIKLEHRANVASYRELLEKIYNYRRQIENKVSFKYLNV